MEPRSIELLQAMPIFGALDEGALACLLEQSSPVRVRAGDFFFREGDEATSMFVLESGQAAVLKAWQGRQFVLRTMNPGDCFGEMALMDLFPRSASVRAVADCTAITLAPADLQRLFERDVEQFALIQMNIGREVCRRLRETDELLFSATMGKPPEALAQVFQSL